MISNAPGGTVRARRGLALVTAIFIILVLAIVGSTMVRATSLHARSTRNETAAIRLQQVAYSGVAHAIGLLHEHVTDDPMTALLKGVDTTWNTADDSLLVGYGIPVSEEIPKAGVLFGTDRYSVRVMEDPPDSAATPSSTTRNNRLMLSCVATSPAGTRVEVRAIVQRTQVPSDAMTIGGNMVISSPFTFNGNCGTAHVNGQFTGTGTPNATAGFSHTSAIAIPASYVGTKTAGVATRSIPTLNYASLCPTTPGTNLTGDQSLDATTLSGNYCINGNLTLRGSMSGIKNFSLIVNGSVTTTTGTSLKFRRSRSDGYVLVAMGDLNFLHPADMVGTVYCGGQINFAAKVTVNGMVRCAGSSSHVGTNLVTTNTISADGKITNACGSTPGQFGEWSTLYWYRVVGS